ncbi:MAG: HAMP domain-containing sensor histidine kinase [Rudaea sp.]|nr:HAMP domain-containing sensor histidine kinase [Rudaea sp.]
MNRMADQDDLAPAPVGVRWHPSTTRLIVIYGAFFLLWSIVLIGTISWQTTQYLDQIVGEILQQRVHYLASVERVRLPLMLAATSELDLRGVMFYGLFDTRGAYLSGNIDRLPESLPPDGLIHPLPNGVQAVNGEHSARALAVALRLESGDMLVLARYTSVADRIGAMTRSALGWALSLMLIPGLIGGFLLSRGPLKRVRRIETAIQPIMRGDLGARLPVSDRRDELDMLATIVNRMLDQVERLLGEVKGVSDSIAHDLRTPLTRLRTLLYRVQQQSQADDPRAGMIERCIADVDALLDRFRALLRISELEDLRRRAGFGEVDLGETLQRIHELYAPLAEEKNIVFTLTAAALPPLQADAHLLFEAISNLVDNAIKFTPAQGRIELCASAQAAGARIDVLDSGPGIPASERQAVLRRFYRSKTTLGDDDGTGHGLGLSVVAAIAKLHGYCFEIADNAGEGRSGGARMTVYCWPCQDAGARTT